MFRWLAGLPLLVLPTIALAAGVQTHGFHEPVDALSVGMPSDAIDLEVSGFDGDAWTPWQRLEIEKEFDPLLRESSLVMFPRAVTAVRLRGTTMNYALHPIRVSRDPANVRAASTADPSFHVLSRREWGADESLLTQGTSTARSDILGEHNEVIPQTSAESSNGRVRDCEEMYAKYPDEFRRARTEPTEIDGKPLRWAREYSPSVRLLVVHHTAIAVEGDDRSGVEKMRALYQYHSNNRGWGDIGYNFVIDDAGRIFEGRSGGDYVVSGHAYCNNVGTVGIALMGNFDAEEPTQAQIRSLQRLLDFLARKYAIDARRPVTFHGKQMPPIVGHRDLLSTDCPGYYAYGALDQIRTNVINGDLSAPVTFPPPPQPLAPPEENGNRYVDRMEERRKRRESLVHLREGLHAVGGVALEGRPGEEQAISVTYQAGNRAHQRRSSIGDIRRSNDRIGLWLAKSGEYERLRDALFLPQFLNAGEEMRIQLKIQFPREVGTQTLQIGDLLYTLTTSGRRVRTPGGDEAAPGTPSTRRTSARSSGATSTANASRINPRVQRAERPATVTSPSALSARRSPQTEQAASAPSAASASRTIRIRLSVPAGDTIVVRGDETVTFSRNGGACVASPAQSDTRSGVVRMGGGDAVLTIASWNTPRNRFRGVLECRVIDGTIVLINELPIEEYLAGLAEEPDTEPYEKQRAFAIAARSYASYYLDAAHRKFPGMPYDGSDSAAVFQKYGGVAFEEENPQWARAVRDTTGTFLTVNGAIIKVPYFTSDDGRTRSPAEAKWTSFPHPEIFASKPDPWCKGMPLAGHGVGMSGCGAKGQANEGRTAEEILRYYYPGTSLGRR